MILLPAIAPETQAQTLRIVTISSAKTTFAIGPGIMAMAGRDIVTPDALAGITRFWFCLLSGRRIYLIIPLTPHRVLGDMDTRTIDETAPTQS
jgi:hypothetical protein